MPLSTAKCNDSVRIVGNAEVIRSPSTLRPAVQKRVQCTWITSVWITSGSAINQELAVWHEDGLRCFSQNRGHMKSR